MMTTKRCFCITVLFVAGASAALAATFTVTAAANSGAGTLQAAIIDANSNLGLDTIVFSLPGPGPYSINAPCGLPDITDPVIIDGTTQPGYAGQPIIELDGSGSDSCFIPSSNGLTISAGSCTIRGLVINRYSNSAIHIRTAGSNKIEGCFLGTDITGNLNRGNLSNGIYVQGTSDNTIGGALPQQRNIISSNGLGSLTFSGAGCVGNLVLGNIIGLNTTGTQSLGNFSGIYISGGSGNTIGGTNAAHRNVISANGGPGISISGSTGNNNLIQGNYIGTDISGTTSGLLGNFSSGVQISSGSNNTVGGTSSDSRNIIAGNGGPGVNIYLAGATGNMVRGNYIGTDITGTIALCNNSGVIIAGCTGNSVGGTVPGSGNLISGNLSSGVSIYGSGGNGNSVQGNLIGTDVNGTSGLGNVDSGVTVATTGTLIGGSSVSARNVISGNEDGVYLSGAGASGNFVQGNFIGTDVSGTTAIANRRAGVMIAAAPSNTIGGTAAGEGNVISGNRGNGIHIYSDTATGNLVQGNLIGVGKDGNAAIANATASGILSSGAGVYIEGAPGNTIGGSLTFGSNVISGNKGSGVLLRNLQATGNLIKGNRIGVDAAGSAGIGNSESGVVAVFAPSNTIGGIQPGEGNVISANGEHGVLLENGQGGNTVTGNLIGSDIAGFSSLGNVEDGVQIDSSPGTTVGGGGTAGNLVAFNGGRGIAVLNGTGNLLTNNSVHSNASLGIDLAGDGVTGNDTDDADSGPNLLQNVPDITWAGASGGDTRIKGTLKSAPSASYTLEFFWSYVADASGSGEGQFYLGSAIVATGPGSTVPFDVTFGTEVPLGKYIAATASSTGNDTSEFSFAYQVNTPIPVGVSVFALE